MPPFPHKHLLGIEPLSREDILTIIDLADQLLEILGRPMKRVPTLRGKTLINFFMEPADKRQISICWC